MISSLVLFLNNVFLRDFQNKILFQKEKGKKS
jgi:hypothetical protein